MKIEARIVGIEPMIAKQKDKEFEIVNVTFFTQLTIKEFDEMKAKTKDWALKLDC